MGSYHSDALAYFCEGLENFCPNLLFEIVISL